MRRLASGVSVVTSVWQGVRHGMTVTSFVSVALDPPLVTITLAKGTRTEQMVRASGRFGVSILASDQQHIAEIFSGKVPEQANRFADIAVFELEEGLPLISGGLGAMPARPAGRR